MLASPLYTARGRRVGASVHVHHTEGSRVPVRIPTASSASEKSSRAHPRCRRPSRRDLLLSTSTVVLGVGVQPGLWAAGVGPEFESVVFPRYSGFVTLPSGVQIRDLCVGDGAEVAGVEGTSALGASGSKDDGGGDGDGESVIVTIEWGMWTVHQGRMVTSLLPLAAAAVPASTSKISTAGKPVATATAGAAVVAAPETAGGGGTGRGERSTASLQRSALGFCSLYILAFNFRVV